MKIGDVFPSNYLKASDLNGAQVTVTIDRVEVEQIGREKESRPVLHFVGKAKGMVLNKTNAKKLVEIAGSDDTDDWHGVQVTLFAAMVEFQGDQVEALRIKAPVVKAAPKPKPVPQPQPATDLDEESIPF